MLDRAGDEHPAIIVAGMSRNGRQGKQFRQPDQAAARGIAGFMGFSPLVRGWQRCKAFERRPCYAI
jgi:hypothetical protein